jgi:glycosyltransferase involved in cell wall biosynthesis
VLFVGSINPMKGTIELARAVLALPQCELIVVGGEARAADADSARLQQEALDELREQGRLVEMGQLPAEAVLRAYEEVDVFVLPSHREGLPNVILEALAAGTPIVATPVGAIPDVLEDDCGVLVPLKDAGALEAALRELIESPERRRELADKGRARIEERYSIDVVMRGYVEIYRSVM